MDFDCVARLDSVERPVAVRGVLQLRFGVAGEKPMKLAQIGRVFKITRERVRQIEVKALRKLQHPMRSRELEGFLDAPAE